MIFRSPNTGNRDNELKNEENVSTQSTACCHIHLGHFGHSHQVLQFAIAISNVRKTEKSENRTFSYRFTMIYVWHEGTQNEKTYYEGVASSDAY